MTDAPDLVNSIVIQQAFGHNALMKTLVKICVLGMGLAACGPLSIYSKPGASVSRMQNDTLNCEVKALKDAPVANEVRQSPPIYFPAARFCGIGNCYYRPGYWGGGQIITVDTNKDLRSRVLDQCMAQKGYQPAIVPRCSAAVAAQVKPAITQTLPPLTKTSCSVFNQDGTWQIVTPISSAASQ